MSFEMICGGIVSMAVSVQVSSGRKRSYLRVHRKHVTTVFPLILSNVGSYVLLELVVGNVFVRWPGAEPQSIHEMLRQIRRDGLEPSHITALWEQETYNLNPNSKLILQVALSILRPSPAKPQSSLLRRH